MSTLRFIIPGSYFLKSRLKAVKDIIFHFYYEWLISFLLLCYFSGNPVWVCTLHFLLAYLAFISVYEIGYLGNDLYSVRFEASPRHRLPGFNPTRFHLICWVSVRVLTFLVISVSLQVITDFRWISFYGALAVVFFLHNLLKIKELRSFTFVCLAFSRFFAPIFIFLTNAQLQLLFVPVFLNYVVYRTFNYMNSKDVLIIPRDQLSLFKITYYCFAGLISIALSRFIGSYFPLYINLYYLAFWLIIIAKEKLSS